MKELLNKTIVERGVVDAHHHMGTHEQRRQRDVGFWQWLKSSYLTQLVVPCGLTSDRLFGQRDPTALDSLLDRTRATTHYQCARLGLAAAFGYELNELRGDSWQDLDRLIRDATQTDDWSIELLRREINLVDGVLDKHVGGTLVDAMTCGTHDWYRYITEMRPAREVADKSRRRDVDSRFTHASSKIDSLLYGHLPCARDELDLFFGPTGRIDDLDAYIAYVGQAFARLEADPHTVALKTAIGDVRRIHYPVVSAGQAALVFQNRTPQTVCDFENFMMHSICDLAAQHRLVFQFHTGMGPNGLGGYIADDDANPALLTSLILEHPHTRFDLMHAGYPHWRESAMMAARFPNVYLNLSWCSLISTADLHHLLDSWIDQVPAHKIIWGSDCAYAEETVGAFLLCRRALVDRLEARVSDGILTAEQAADYATNVFCDNARGLFGI